MVTGARAAFPASYGMGAGIERGSELEGTGSSGRAEGGEAEDPGAGAGAKAEGEGPGGGGDYHHGTKKFLRYCRSPGEINSLGTTGYPA